MGRTLSSISCIIMTFVGLSNVSHASPVDIIDSREDSVQSRRSEVFFEFAGSSVLYSIGYSFDIVKKEKTRLKFKLGLGYWQDWTNPIYNDYALISHSEILTYFKISRKLELGPGFGVTIYQNPFLILNPDFDCSGGPTSCEKNTFPYFVYGFHISQNISKRISLDYRFLLLDDLNMKYPVNFWPWPGITFIYKI
jgi:hypothetical protein